MSGQLPFFMSGPRMVIKADGKILAFAVGLDINVSRNVQSIYQFGQVGPVALQATLYNGVTGNMQIIKLADVDARKAKSAGLANANYQGSVKPTGAVGVGTTPNGQSGNTQSLNTAIQATENVDNSMLNYSTNMQKQLDPEQVLLSHTFDIEVWQTYPATVDASVQTRPNASGYKTVKHFTISNCRLNSRGTSISPGSLTSEAVSFVGTLLVNEARDDGIADQEDTVAEK